MGIRSTFVVLLVAATFSASACGEADHPQANTAGLDEDSTATDSVATTTPESAAGESVSPTTSAPATADPAQADDPVRSEGLPATFFGVEAIPATTDASVLDLAFEAAAGLGVHHVGINRVLWDDIEPNPPAGGVHTYDWSMLDAMAQRALEYDLQLQLTVQVVSGWGTEAVHASGGPSSESAPVRPEHLDDYDRFIEALVARYNAGGNHVLSILMIANESEVPGHWAANGTGDNPATPSTYQDLLARTAAIARTVDPDLVVARASTNFGAAFDDRPSQSDVAGRLVEQANGTDAFVDAVAEGLSRIEEYDAFAVHPNHGSDAVEAIASYLEPSLGDALLIAEDMRSTRVMSAHMPDVWSDSDGNGIEDVVDVLDTGQAIGSMDRVTAETVYRAAQSDTLVEKVVLAAASGYDVVFVSSLVDFGATYPIPTWRYTGLIQPAGGGVESRPAYHAYRELIAALTGAAIGPVERGNGVVSVAVGAMTVVWPDTPGREVELELAAGEEALRFPRVAGETTLVPVERNGSSITVVSPTVLSR